MESGLLSMMGVSLPKGPIGHLIKPFFFLISLFGRPIFSRPDDPSDLVITIEAEDQHDFRARLPEIKAPTLVIAGDKDPLYTETLFRETGEGIQDATLVLYRGMGHPAAGKQFKEDLRAFLLEA